MAKRSGRARQDSAEAAVPVEPGGGPQQPGSGKPPVWIAVYTRKSNDENLTGEVTSLDNQKAACRAYIQIQTEKGWREYPEVFDDPAESGKSLKRPAIQRLLQRIQEGKVQGVMVYKLDRMTRNSRDFHMLLELFEKHNVAFISATESIDTKSPQGRLMTAIMVQFAQYDREMDVERSKDFHLARARKGLWCGGIAPLGYDLKEKQLVVNESEAAIVRRIFELYLKRPSALRVAEELNRLGLRRKTHKTYNDRLYGGKPFDIDSVIRILRRKVYIGIITNERTGQEFPGLHQPLIPPREFEKAQKSLDEHNQREGGQILYAANKHGFLLRGLVRCGHCGGAVVSYVRPKNGKDYLYYKCLAQQNGLPIPCAFKSAPARKLEEYVVEKLAAIGWDRDFLDQTVRRVDGRAKNGTAPLEAERRSGEERLRGLQNEVQNLINLVKSGGTNPDVEAELERLKSAKAALEARQAELEAAVAHRRGAVYDVDVMAGMLRRFARFVGRVPLDVRVRAIRLMVKRVTVWKDKIDVETYETAAKDLQNAINGGGSLGGKFKSGRSQTARAKNHRCPGAEANGSGTAVGELRLNWRGRRDLNPRSPP